MSCDSILFHTLNDQALRLRWVTVSSQDRVDKDSMVLAFLLGNTMHKLFDAFEFVERVNDLPSLDDQDICVIDALCGALTEVLCHIFGLILTFDDV